MWAMLICCGAGALVRYVFSKVNSRASLPLGTLLANLNDELADLFSERKKFLLYLALTYILGFLAILLGIFI